MNLSKHLSVLYILTALGAFSLLFASTTLAQETIQIRSGPSRSGITPAQMTPEIQAKIAEAKAKAEAAQKGTPPKAAEAKPGEKKEEPKKGEPKGPVQRGDMPPEPADKKELEVRPDEDGLVRFNFRGQAWKDVLDWLSDISNESLDWQELPSDYLNLTTQRAYTVDEVRDIINERLLTRGYTMLHQREGFVVVKVDKIDPAQVPRVHPEDLRYRDDHEIVKVSLPLSWLIAEATVEELKPMLSPHGKMIPLKTSNRIEAMDSVVNLREIYHVLQEEQSTESESSQVTEFELQFVRAEVVKEHLEGLLGMSSTSKKATPMTPQQMQMMQQQMQQQQRSGGKPSPTAAKPKSEVYLVVNQRRNSILANAPPDKLVIIAQTIRMLDVQSSPSNSLSANLTRMQIYRLAQLDPETLISMVEEVGELEPGTQLVADKKNNAVIAYASVADHYTVQTIIEKLDGSGRQFEVIRLRRLKADSVAVTIRTMMGNEEEKKDSGRSSYYSSYYSSRYSSQKEETGNTDKFKVDADVVNNRLLLWSNELELEGVTKLLVKLGEIPMSGSPRNNVRSFDIGSSDNVDDMLRRLKEIWPSVSPNPLQIERAEPKVEPVPETEKPVIPDTGLQKKNTPPVSSEPDTSEPVDKSTNTRWQVPVHFAQVTKQQPVEKAEQTTLNIVAAEVVAEPGNPVVDPAITDIPGVTPENAELYQKYFGKKTPEQAVAETPPVTIKVDENGRMTVTSSDPRVLDLLEDLIQEMTPPPKDWEIFQLEYASAYWVSFNLEDFFEEEDEDSNPFGGFFFGYGGGDSNKDDPTGLSTRKPLKFITDVDTNTILVQGADNEQLATIQRLIDLYDVPQEVTAQSARMTSLYQVKYSKAENIANSVKEVFRDLLSTNDKSLQGNQGEQRQKSEQRTYITNIGGGDDKPEPSQTKINFKGKISIGVDEITNTLLLSIEGESLMNLVLDMIKSLDEAAKPVSTVRVLSMTNITNPEAVKATLAKILNAESGDGKGQQQNRPNNGQQPGEPNPGQGQQPGGGNPAQGNPR
ncbi:MAG: secretin N-terminal domain-containing protein [Pirellulales bacterium]